MRLLGFAKYDADGNRVCPGCGWELWMTDDLGGGSVADRYLCGGTYIFGPLGQNGHPTCPRPKKARSPSP